MCLLCVPPRFSHFSHFMVLVFIGKSLSLRSVYGCRNHMALSKRRRQCDVETHGAWKIPMSDWLSGFIQLNKGWGIWHAHTETANVPYTLNIHRACHVRMHDSCVCVCSEQHESCPNSGQSRVRADNNTAVIKQTCKAKHSHVRMYSSAKQSRHS